MLFPKSRETSQLPSPVTSSFHLLWRLCSSWHLGPTLSSQPSASLASMKLAPWILLLLQGCGSLWLPHSPSCAIPCLQPKQRVLNSGPRSLCVICDLARNTRSLYNVVTAHGAPLIVLSINDGPRCPRQHTSQCVQGPQAPTTSTSRSHKLGILAGHFLEYFCF